MIPTGFSFPEVLKKNSKEHEDIFKYGAVTLYGSSFQKILLIPSICLTPSVKRYSKHQNSGLE
jgi:hypothetical protein